MNDDRDGERPSEGHRQASPDNSRPDFTNQESAFAMLRAMPRAHLSAFYGQMRELDSSAAEPEPTRMSASEYYKEMGRTKRELYRRWAHQCKASPDSPDQPQTSTTSLPTAIAPRPSSTSR